MKSRLKRLRLAAGMTQTKVALAMGMSQPNYQRWEAGTAAVPAGKLKKLARVLKTSVDAILGRPPAFDRLGINPAVSDDRTYYGEVAVHFIDRNALLLPISEAVRVDLYQQFQGSSDFVAAESLDNRIVFLRREAIADVYFSSEAYDDRGPEEYPDHLGIWPEDDFWQIVEHRDTPEELADQFDDGEIERVLAQIEGSAPEDAQRFFERATQTCWQLLSGSLRREYVYSNETLFDTFDGLRDPDDADGLILLPLEGYHRSILIQKSAVGYFSVPRHKFYAGLVALSSKNADD